MSSMANSSLERIRITVLFEGASYLLLLFVAMPLKYLADRPLAVTLVGSVHGFLFIILCGLLFFAFVTGSIRFKRALLIFVASLIPFVPFIINHKLKPAQETDY